MSYKINDLCHVLKLNLTTDQTTVSSLKLNTYVNNSTDVAKTYTTSNGTFIIPHTDYNLNDIITKFELLLDGSTYLWQTNEGIKYLLDGEEYVEKTVNEDESVTLTDTFHTNTLKLKFKDADAHTLEGVYVGNDAYIMCTTGKYHFNIKQIPIDEEGSLQNDGAYKLTLLNPVSEMTYKDGTVLEFQLTKGGVPVPNRTVERVTPTEIASYDTDAKGIVKIQNTDYDCGTYEFGAYYQDETTHKNVTSEYKKIKINKGTPTLSDNYESAGTFVRNSTYVVNLKFKNTNIANTNVIMYINDKTTTQKTDASGNVRYKFATTGTYVIKTVFKGNKNLGKVELKRTFTIEE